MTWLRGGTRSYRRSSSQSNTANTDKNIACFCPQWLRRSTFIAGFTFFPRDRQPLATKGLISPLSHRDKGNLSLVDTRHRAIRFCYGAASRQLSVKVHRLTTRFRLISMWRRKFTNKCHLVVVVVFALLSFGGLAP